MIFAVTNIRHFFRFVLMMLFENNSNLDVKIGNLHLNVCSNYHAKLQDTLQKVHFGVKIGILCDTLGIRGQSKWNVKDNICGGVGHFELFCGLFG